MARHSESNEQPGHRPTRRRRETHIPDEPAQEEEWEDGDDVEWQPESDEIWESLDLANDEETQPEYGDFWHEPIDDEE